MTTILLNGTPKTGKSGLALRTTELMDKHFGETVHTVSIGDLITEEAKRCGFGGKLSYIESYIQEGLRQAAFEKTKNILVKIKHEKDVHTIIETPLSMFYKNGTITDAIFSQWQIQQFHNILPIDYMVTLIESPSEVVKNLEGTAILDTGSTSQNINTVLDWTANEVNLAKVMRPYQLDESGEINYESKHLIIPRPGSDTSLAKLLIDDNPLVAYLAGPITRLKPGPGDSKAILEEKKQARKKMIWFQNELQKYVVLIAPLILADNEMSEKGKNYTIERDILWFITISADMVIGHFPSEKYDSTGTKEELRHTGRIGKPNVLIHPSTSNEVFGFKPLYHHKSAEEFLDALPKTNDPNYKRLINNNGLPRYHMLFEK